MTRVLHVVHSLGMGGLEKGIATVVSNRSEGIHHEVLCLDRSGDAAKLMPNSTPIHEMHAPAGNSLRFVRRLARKLREIAPDVVHSRNWAGMDAIVAAHWAGVRLVHGEHGWDVGDPTGSSRKRRVLRRFLQRWVAEYTCVSRHLASWLRESVCIRKPISQIYNGVDTDCFRPGDGRAVRAELDLGSDTFVVGIAARLDPIKDHETLFEAFDRLRDKHPDSALLVVGDGPRREALARLAGPGIRMVGHRADVARTMRALDLFALPSKNEGISNTILEAMATGLPVVASRVGGTPELVDDGVEGRLFAPGDTDELADALRSYADNPDRRRREGDAARRRALDRYSIRAMVDGYESVWRRVVP